jgi:hypothetical protein
MFRQQLASDLLLSDRIAQQYRGERPRVSISLDQGQGLALPNAHPAPPAQAATAPFENQTIQW